MEESSLWGSLKKRYDELNEQLISSALESNKRHIVQKELSIISTILNKYQELSELKKSYEAVLAQERENKDPELAPLFAEELSFINNNIHTLEKEIETILYPPNKLDRRSVFVEIRAGTGGQEAALFVSDLLRMYTLYALKKGWKCSLMSESHTDLGGYREVILHIEDDEVFGHLKFESGVHRVQRVPVTETSGRIHTSTATVAVLPEAEEVELSISPSDLRIDVYRSGGAGGQHVNTTDSAVRITHIPTGVVVTCQDERSQHKNKAKALKVLQSRLLAAQQEKNEAEMSQKRKELVGTGMRAEKVRTYNFPQNRVTDHTIDLTLKKLDMILEGNLDDIIEPLREHEHAQRKKSPAFIFAT